MGKYVVGVIVLLLIIIGGFYFWSVRSGSGAPSATSTSAVTQPAATATTTFATSTFSIVYPVDYTVDPNFQNTEVSADKPISGVKFTIPTTSATGTNLASDTYISVEQLPHAKNCTGDIYVANDVTASTVTDNGVTYSVATTTGAAAGNLYEETVYAIASSSPCTAVRYWIHSSNLGNYDPGAVTAYNKDALISSFDTIRRSLQLTQ